MYICSVLLWFAGKPLGVEGHNLFRKNTEHYDIIKKLLY